MGKIEAAAESAARKTLPGKRVKGILVQAATGSEGQEILRVTIIVDDEGFDQITGEKFVETLVSIKRRIRETGDERQAIVGYATQADLSDGDPES